MSDVAIWLQVGDERIAVDGMTCDKCTIREPTQRDPCSAHIVVVINGGERRKRVYLPNGIASDSLDVVYK